MLSAQYQAIFLRDYVISGQESRKYDFIRIVV